MKSIQKGRPTKRSPQLERSLLKSIEDGLPLSHAAAIAGISYETLCEWRRRFPDFSDSISRSVALGVASRLRIIRNAADSGDVGSAKWWLEHVMPEHFARNRMDITHNHQGTLDHRIGFDQQMLEQIAEARRLYEQRN